MQETLNKQKVGYSEQSI